MQQQTEVIEGYLIDLACVRKYPQDELLKRAKAHTRACALDGHCVESGYAVVGEDGRLMVLDPEATPKVVTALLQEQQDTNIKLRVERASNGTRMKTVSVIRS